MTEFTSKSIVLKEAVDQCNRKQLAALTSKAVLASVNRIVSEKQGILFEFKSDVFDSDDGIDIFVTAKKV